MESEVSDRESKITTSWTQTSRPCTPLDVLVTRPYIPEEHLHLPPLLPPVAVSVTVPKLSLENPSLVSNECTSKDQTKTAKTKSAKLTNRNTRRLMQISESQNKVSFSSCIDRSEDPSVLREHNTTPVSLVSDDNTRSKMSSPSVTCATLEEGRGLGDSTSGPSLPVAKVKSDTMLVRNVRNRRSIADLNSLRNKYINYDQYRLTKRKNEPGKSGHIDNDHKPQLAIGDFDFGKTQANQFASFGRSRVTETRSGPRFNSNEPRRREFTMTRSKTYAGPVASEEKSASSSNREADRDGLLCAVKGLRKQSPPITHNTPHVELLSPRDNDQIKMPNLNKYFTSSSPDPSKIVGIAVGNGVISDSVRKPLKSSGRHFRPKKENSKLVLKFYSDEKSKARDTLQLSHDASLYNYTLRQAQLESARHRPVKDTIDEIAVSRQNQPGLHPDKPVSLTAKNLEIFDHLTTNERTKCDKISEESDSDTNARVLDWLVQGKLVTQQQVNPVFKAPANGQVITVAP